ncbi:MAG: protoporphyrinogen oxidase, partial [Acidobacteriota bacterium]
MRRTSVVVVGAGITGLTCAYGLGRRSIDCLLVEKRERAGGNVQTDRTEGFILDAGPDAFLTQKPEALSLCRELGLEARLLPTNPAERDVYVLFRGRLHPLPEGMVLAVPTRLLPLALSRLFSPLGKLRMGLEVCMPRRRGEGEESIASFIERRFGREALERLAEPLLGGVHSGSPERLSMNRLFPRIVALEEKHGSLVRGMRKARAARRSGPPPPLFLSLTDGLSELVDALVRRLRPGTLLLESEVRRVQRKYDTYRTELASGETLVSPSLVLALPLRQAEQLARGISSRLAEALAKIPTVSTAVVFLAFPRENVRHPLAGYGFVVPRSEKRRILAASFVSTKFPNRSPRSHVLLRAFLGGDRDPGVLKSTDPALVELVHRELEAILGSLGTPTLARVYRWPDATPQIEVGHGARLTAIDEALGAHPGLHVAGNGLRGVGIPDCIADARRVAAELVRYL